jgi:large subunit ribosomal protein L5|uniref:Large ribosomal subunit protein uL5c n=2 Tax=Cyanidioschyzon merolae TaxID=45157 RepID=RK5_CYAM1|nr:ribosomal protein L5 [Cyanidioschyzon merolae strain 10D]Q85FV1.1 RecName: Full=Large ribosomal subunit protein uL5c; AltName: Full=50S ribosomal protein L5, chloroplastic [Cyanidioschyzon merolae strain 10D]QFV17032.1 50S ribosomal protein L5 [Cyanidioschyzon merolae]BAC76243.1 50S ribosomal protein L5 [Cyanidioschyzon merolae strain 10D]
MERINTTFYKTKVIPQLQQKYSYSNVHQIPKLRSIHLNRCLGAVSQKIFQKSSEEIAMISGQRPKITYAKKAIAGFQIRKGMPIGMTVTLRRERMYDFLTKFIHLILPRLKDFRGLNPTSFDGNGNYHMGLPDQLAFPEIDYDQIDQYRGMDISIITTAKTDEEAKFLLEALGMRFQ